METILKNLVDLITQTGDLHAVFTIKDSTEFIAAVAWLEAKDIEPETIEQFMIREGLGPEDMVNDVAWGGGPR